MSTANIATADGAGNRNFTRCAYCGEGKKTVQMWAIMGTVVPLHFGCEPGYVKICDEDGRVEVAA
jgi:hypothetical protein